MYHVSLLFVNPANEVKMSLIRRLRLLNDNADKNGLQTQDNSSERCQENTTKSTDQQYSAEIKTRPKSRDIA